MKCLVVALAFFCFSPLLGFTLKEKFFDAKEGDYITIFQDKNYHLLFIRTLTSSELILEEISVPSFAINPSLISWKQWVESEAPGHTAWTLYRLDWGQKPYAEAYSYTKKSWLSIEQAEDFFLGTLLHLPLTKISNEQRKKIGPAPPSGEEDRRPLWTPTLVVDGKKMEKASCEVWKTKWPEDQSPFAGCTLELYFNAKDPAFAFPYWITLQSTHLSLHVQIVDSGKELTLPLSRALPKHYPELSGKIRMEQEALQIPLKIHVPYPDCHLFAQDLTQPEKANIALPFTLVKSIQRDLYFLSIPKTHLQAHLEQGHCYRWIVIFEHLPDFSLELDELFVWTQKEPVMNSSSAQKK